MSQEIGSQLPPPLRFELGAHPTGGLPKAVLLVSADDDGSPRVAVVGASELSVRDASHLGFRVQGGSVTCRNLKRTRKAGLWYVLDAAAYCIRGDVNCTTRDGDEFNHFEMTVTSVLKDFQPGAPMVSGPTYKPMQP
jgi:hypothetical protein